MEAPPTVCIVIVITADPARSAIRGALALRACPDGAHFARRLAVGMHLARLRFQHHARLSSELNGAESDASRNAQNAVSISASLFKLTMLGFI